ncbi:MAG: 3'-5' exonuclease domain-containing protein 2 [Cyclobacteriaceae bacterium]|nr:3'-5' exonuclease domain-containing protein 2 [Cyclobacteriaceae bacterium]
MTLRERITSEEVNALPLKAYTGKIVLIDREEAIEEAISEIEKYEVVGFDTESKPSFQKGEFHHVSLLQFAIPGKVFLFRINITGLTKRICSLLENPGVIKLGVALHDDIIDLKKLGKFSPKGFKDIHSFIKKHGVVNSGLRKLTAMILGFRISKSQQTSNWENPVLSHSQKVYAATDAWVCLKMYKKLSELGITD